MALWTLSGTTTRVSQYQKIYFAIFWIFWCKMKITQADTPTIRMYCHSIQTNWCPQLCHLHHFYAGCPSWHNPLNLSWLGTGTKYRDLHTRWLGSWKNGSETKAESKALWQVATNLIWQRTMQCFIETSWSQQCRINEIWPAGSS